MDQPPQTQASRRMVGMVASSYGPRYLAEILGELPRDFALPILLFPTAPAYFLKQFVAALAERCRLRVTAAEDGQVPEAGTIYVASCDPCLRLAQGCHRLEPCPAENQPRNILFRSMAQDLGPGAIAVILSGLASDGAEGMKAVRDAGGYTIAQDEATSLIYGIAHCAVEMNAVCESLPVQEIAPRLLALVAPGPPEPT